MVVAVAKHVVLDINDASAHVLDFSDVTWARNSAFAALLNVELLTLTPSYRTITWAKEKSHPRSLRRMLRAGNSLSVRTRPSTAEKTILKGAYRHHLYLSLLPPRQFRDSPHGQERRCCIPQLQSLRSEISGQGQPYVVTVFVVVDSLLTIDRSY